MQTFKSGSEILAIFDDISDFAEATRGKARLAGLDLGTKTIGLALCDAGWQFAAPSHTLKRSKFAKDMAALLTFFSAEQVGGIVLGLPLNMDGSAGARVQATRAFGRNLSQETEIPITYWDERLSTVAAERRMLEADLSRKKRAARLDAAAAAHILQGAIDRLRHLTSE